MPADLAHPWLSSAPPTPLVSPPSGYPFLPSEPTTPVTPPGWTGVPTGFSPTYGGIPNLPPYTTDTTSMIGENPWAQIGALAPGALGNTQAQVANIGQNLAGQVSAPDLAQFQQQSAERGVRTGQGGGPNTNAAYLRALGLTQMQLQALGQTQQNQFLSSFPLQRQQTGTQTTDLSGARAQYGAAPIPAYAHAANNRAMMQGMGNFGNYNPNAWISQVNSMFSHPSNMNGPGGYTPTPYVPGTGPGVGYGEAGYGTEENSYWDPSFGTYMDTFSNFPIEGAPTVNSPPGYEDYGSYDNYGDYGGFYEDVWG